MDNFSVILLLKLVLTAYQMFQTDLILIILESFIF